MAGRSPNYPALTLREAIEKARRVYAAQHTYAKDSEVVAKNLNYKGLNGASMPIIAALRRYGLLEQEGENLKISDDAVTILELPEDNADRAAALRRAAFATPLFAEMNETYGDRVPNDVVLRHDLIKKKFLPKAADEVIRIYRDNLELVTQQAVEYNAGGVPSGNTQGGQPPMSHAQTAQRGGVTAAPPERSAPPSGQGVYEFSFPLSFQRDVKAIVTIYGEKIKRRDLEFLQKKVGDLLEGFEDEEPEPIKAEPEQPKPAPLPQRPAQQSVAALFADKDDRGLDEAFSQDE